MLQRDDNIAGFEAELAPKSSLGTAAASFSSAGARGLQIRFLFAASSSPEHQPPRRPTSAPGFVETFLVQPVCAF